jgi:hypothetical protein
MDTKWKQQLTAYIAQASLSEFTIKFMGRLLAESNISVPGFEWLFLRLNVITQPYLIIFVYIQYVTNTKNMKEDLIPGKLHISE